MGWLETGERGQSELHLLVLKHTAESVGKEENQGSFATQSSDSTTSFRRVFSDEYRELLFCLLEEASVQMVSVHSSPLCLSHTHRSTWRHHCPQMTLWEGFALTLLLSLKPNELLMFGSPHPSPAQPRASPKPR